MNQSYVPNYLNTNPSVLFNLNLSEATFFADPQKSDKYDDFFHQRPFGVNPDSDSDSDTVSNQTKNTLDSWNEFVNKQTQLHEVLFKLGKIESTDEILKQGVIYARNTLGFDRIGMLLYDEKNDDIVGTWGTDEEGNLSDEHASRSPCNESDWHDRIMSSHDYTSVWEGVELKQWEKSVGKGWNAISGMWDGEKCIGWIACDNLLSLKPLESWRSIILGQFTKSIGSLIIQSNQKQELKFINDNLEKLVDKQNTQLRLKIQQLETAKNNLVESEKLASLGGLVAGVAHEINTPVGIGITAASFLKEKSELQLESYYNKTMKKSDLEIFFKQVTGSSDIILKNLNQAGNLVHSFKKIAVNQTNDLIDDVNLNELVNDLLLSFKHIIKNRPISIVNNVDKDINFKSYAGRISQILSNLIKNSLLHGFDKNDTGTIKINASIKGDQLYCHYFDTGKGVPEKEIDSILNPFYTTKRGQGGTGLGLNIIYNIISKMKGSIKIKNNESEQGLRIDFDIKVNKYE